MSTLSASLPGISGARELRRSLRRAERRRKLRAFSLTLPLLVFLMLTFVVPIAGLLERAVENPEVAQALPRTVQVLAHWDRKDLPPAQAFSSIVADLSALPDISDAGALARRLNAEVPGARSLVMGTYRALPLEGASTPDAAKARLIEHDERWTDLRYWHAIAKNGSRWTADYLLASVDLRRDAQGHVARMPPDQRVFGNILARTFEVSAIVTLWCLLLGYPLAYWLSTLPARRANMLMILVLVPFWTSILVRVAAWIVLLQSGGLVNRALLATGLIEHPLALLFNRTGVIVAMVHILLPFMILPLYSVMKSVPADLPARRRIAGQSPAGRVLPRRRAADLCRHRRRLAAGVHPEHRLLRDARAARRSGGSDAELLRRAIHECQCQLGHGQRAGRLAPVGHARPLRRVPPRGEVRTQPGMNA